MNKFVFSYCFDKNYSALGRQYKNSLERSDKSLVPLHFTLYAIHQNRGSAAQVTFEILKQ